MTNAEAREYLDQYPVEQVAAALEQLGYNINSPTFPESIIADVEAIIEATGQAVVRHKQLQAAQTPSAEPLEPKSEALVIQETAAIAAEILDVRNINVDPKALFAVAQLVVVQTKHEAAAINKLRRETLVAELRKGQQQLTDDLLEVMKTGQESSLSLFSEDNLQKMVDRAVPAYRAKFDVDQFINDVKIQATELVNEGNETIRVGADARATQIDFDLDSFLDGVWE